MITRLIEFKQAVCLFSNIRMESTLESYTLFGSFLKNKELSQPVLEYLKSIDVPENKRMFDQIRWAWKIKSNEVTIGDLLYFLDNVEANSLAAFLFFDKISKVSFRYLMSSSSIYLIGIQCGRICDSFCRIR